MIGVLFLSSLCPRSPNRHCSLVWPSSAAKFRKSPRKVFPFLGIRRPASSSVDPIHRRMTAGVERSRGSRPGKVCKQQQRSTCIGRAACDYCSTLDCKEARGGQRASCADNIKAVNQQTQTLSYRSGQNLLSCRHLLLLLSRFCSITRRGLLEPTLFFLLAVSSSVFAGIPFWSRAVHWSQEGNLVAVPVCAATEGKGKKEVVAGTEGVLAACAHSTLLLSPDDTTDSRCSAAVFVSLRF